eukprot:14604803-Ditylum_brightwellii.AAC.1
MSSDLNIEDVTIKCKSTVKKANLTHIKANCKSVSKDKKNTEAGYNKAKGEIIEKVLGPSAYKEQVKCLQFMKPNGIKLKGEKITSDITTPNLPGILTVNFMKEGGYNLADIKDVLKILKRMEKTERVPKG